MKIYPLIMLIVGLCIVRLRMAHLVVRLGGAGGHGSGANRLPVLVAAVAACFQMIAVVAGRSKVLPLMVMVPKGGAR